MKFIEKTKIVWQYVNIIRFHNADDNISYTLSFGLLLKFYWFSFSLCWPNFSQ
jgi:hypothetical protein